MTAKRVAVYPGTFDPITLGHCDVIKRALKIVDKLVIGVASDTTKNPIFTLDERVALVRADVQRLSLADVIDVQPFKGLLMNFADKHQATIIVRGLRAASDFEYEFQMSGMNAKLGSHIQTVFLPAGENMHFISSRFIKEIARLGGDISEFVSPDVKAQLLAYYNK